MWGDHPRVCGEYALAVTLLPVSDKSPPRVRGIRIVCPSYNHITRITPACAGNTKRQPSSALAATDHPRVCGEYWLICLDAIRRKGSPPRVRGILPQVSARKALARITPACAGNTCPRCDRLRSGRDHPRVCGEYASTSRQISARWGSPPRVRGILKRAKRSAETFRITPACAGNTNPVSLISTSAKDHPRVCGEYGDKLTPDQSDRGSPPRVRGIHDFACFLGGTVRITPACAGNTLGGPHTRCRP